MEYGGVKARYSPKFAIPKRGKRSDRDSYKEDTRCRPKTQRMDEANAAKRPVRKSKRELNEDRVHHIVNDVSNLIGRPVMLMDHGLWATRSRRGGTSVVQATTSKEGDLCLKTNAKRPVIMLRRQSLQVGCNPALRARGGGRKCNGLGAIRYDAPNIT